jgi:hypothetical protein
MRLAKAPVFQDLDSIEPGKQWRIEIAGSIAKATSIVVFWCSHSAASDNVEWEWKEGRRLGKRLVPVRMDSMPLPNDLCEYQGLDLRDSLIHPDILNLRTAARPAVSGPSIVRWALRAFLLAGGAIIGLRWLVKKVGAELSAFEIAVSVLMGLLAVALLAVTLLAVAKAVTALGRARRRRSETRRVADALVRHLRKTSEL